MSAVAFMGCRPSLPDEFPLTMPENSGNMIHARVPRQIFPGAVYSGDSFPQGMSFRKWVNEKSTHLILTLANSFKFGMDSAPQFLKLIETLETYDSELVIFGLGVQSKTQDVVSGALPTEAIQLMKYLGERCKVVGVRGEFTARVFKELAGVENTFVTGCPSAFSNPVAPRLLRENLEQEKPGRFAFNGTFFHGDVESKLLVRAIQHDDFLIEPVNRFNHKYYLDVARGSEATETPYFLRRAIKDGAVTPKELESFFRANYRLFRNYDAWLEFNRELVSFSYGSRFHGNMAAYLSGVPSLWLTHDARTEELIDFLHLPSLPLEKAAAMSPDEIRASYDPADFFAHIQGLFDNFNEYLGIFDLPPLNPEF